MRMVAQQAVYVTPPLGVFAFWGGMSMAARSYPSEYDWRYITISSVVYADRNPNGHLWALGGIALCGLAGLCWAAVLVRKGRQPDAIRIWALGQGYLCMLCCALLPERLLRIPKGHEVLALAAFVGIFALPAALGNTTLGGELRFIRLHQTQGMRRYRTLRM